MAVEQLSLELAWQSWTTLRVGRFRLPHGETVTRDIEDHGWAASVLPFDPVRRTVVMVRQFRAAAFVSAGVEETLEAIAGILDAPDAASEIAREAREEAGLTLADLQQVGKAWVSPGISTERATLFLATYTRPDGPAKWSTEPGVTALELPIATLAADLDAGRIGDLKTLALAQALRHRHPALFA